MFLANKDGAVLLSNRKGNNMEAQREAKETLLAEGQKEYLNPREVNLLYGFSTSTLAKWRMNNINLVFHRMGKYIKYKRSDIVAFIDSNRVDVTS